MTLTLPKSECPLPGIYRDIPSEVYHSWEGASSHRLGTLAQNPNQCVWEMGHPKTPTPAMLLGTAAHVLILEGRDIFEEQYIVSQKCCATKQDGEACKNFGTNRSAGKWFCGTHGKNLSGDLGDKKIISPDEYKILDSMHLSILNNRLVSALLHDYCAYEDRELSIVWIDEATGVKCKARIDALDLERGFLIDLKTTGDASEWTFDFSASDLEYPRQMAFYKEALRSLGIEIKRVFIIAVENVPAHGVNVFRITPKQLEIGRCENFRLLEIWSQCERFDTWPSYEERILDLKLPKRRINWD